MIITSPIYMTVSRKTKKDKKILLGLNWYRNAHYQELNNLKIQYRQMMAPQIQALPKLKWPIKVKYVLYFARICDGWNVVSVVSKFFEDAIVNYSKIPDDNLEYIDSGLWVVGGRDNKNPRCKIIIMES